MTISETHVAAIEDSIGSFRPKSILLTGGAGFIGSHVAVRLTKNHPEYKVRHSVRSAV